MKISKIFTILAFTLALSVGNSTFAKDTQENNSEYKVAVVDISRILESSPSINALNLDRKNKIDSLITFVEKARKEVSAEKDEAKRKVLEESYNKELNDKKAVIDKEYTQKMKQIDKDVAVLIKSTAKQSDYDLVLVKSSVLNGGEDITSDIIKSLK